MSKKLVALVVFVMMVSVSSMAHAEMGDVVMGMGHKLFRGFVNTLTGWIEIPAQVVKGYERGWSGDGENKALGAFGGIFNGIYHGAGRTVSGLCDFSGFWAVDPMTNEGVGIPLEAEYAWESGERYDYCKPSFGEQTLNPMGKKLIRGLGNAILGVAEFPGQIVKGCREKTWDFGVITGIWYWFSREIDGTWDICSFYLPNPATPNELTFTEEWPWDALMGKSAGK